MFEGSKWFGCNGNRVAHSYRAFSGRRKLYVTLKASVQVRSSDAETFCMKQHAGSINLGAVSHKRVVVFVIRGSDLDGHQTLDQRCAATTEMQASIRWERHAASSHVGQNTANGKLDPRRANRWMQTDHSASKPKCECMCGEFDVEQSQEGYS